MKCDYQNQTQSFNRKRTLKNNNKHAIRNYNGKEKAIDNPVYLRMGDINEKNINVYLQIACKLSFIVTLEVENGN